MNRKEKTESWAFTILIATAILMLSFNSVVQFLINISKTVGVNILIFLPLEWLNLVVLLLLIYLVKEHYKIAKILAGRF